MNKDEFKELLKEYSIEQINDALLEFKSVILKKKKVEMHEMIHVYYCQCCGNKEEKTFMCLTNTQENIAIFIDVKTCDKCLPRLSQDFDNVEDCLKYMLTYIKEIK